MILAAQTGEPRGARITRAELIIAGITLFMFTEAFLGKLFSPPPEVSQDGNPTLRYLWLPFYGLVIVGVFLAGRRSLIAMARAPFVILLTLMAGASAAWSIDPALSERRELALVATVLMGVYMAARFDWLTALRLLAATWFAVLVATLVSGVLVPSFAVMDEVHPGAWAGGWWEKNQLGGHAARASFIFAFLIWRDVAWRKVWLGALVTSLALVALSTSATALLGVALGFGVLAAAWWMVRGWARSVLLLWLAGASAGILALLYMVDPGALLSLIGREPTLTGRTDIWVELLHAIRERPWLGYGFQAFWGVDSEPRYWLQKAVEWPAPSGHNGWLDLAISLGLVGVGLFALDLALASARAIRASLAAPVGVFAIGVLAQFLLFSMSESIILFQNSIIWLTYVMVSCKLALDGAHSPINTLATPVAASAGAGGSKGLPRLGA